MLYAIQSKALIFSRFLQVSKGDRICFGTDGVPYVTVLQSISYKMRYIATCGELTMFAAFTLRDFGICLWGFV
jgi:hypothetical protein